MKHTQQLGFGGTFFVRTPLLPYGDLVANAEPLGPDAADAEVNARREEGRNWLAAMLARGEVVEALRIAAPSLLDATAKWRENPESKAGRSTERSVVRYLQRMCARPTPFGAFAGGSVGRVGERDRIRLAPRDSYTVHARVGMKVLRDVCRWVREQPQYRDALVYRANPTVYRVGSELRFQAHRELEGKRLYHLERVAADEMVEALLESANAGLRWSQLVAWLREHADEPDPGEAEAYLTDLVDAQLLAPDLEPPLVSDDVLGDVCARLAEIGAGEAARILADAGVQLSESTELAAGEHRRAAVELLGALPVPHDPARAVYAELAKPAEAELSRDSLAAVRAAIGALHRLVPTPDLLRLERFRDAFVARFGAREVPFVSVLDPDVGVPFPADSGGPRPPLLEGLPFGVRAEAPRVAWGAREQLLLDKLLQARSAGSSEIVLTAADVERLPAPARPLPRAMNVLLRWEPDPHTASPALWLDTVTGPPGARLLGRFATTWPEVGDALRDEAEAEARGASGAVFADVVHLPPGGQGDALCHPPLRAFELEYFGGSSRTAEERLGLDDLTLSVIEGRVVLRSRRLGREVIPRISSAHNFTDVRNLPGYQLLGHLQAQGELPTLAWDWGVLADADFTPGVRFGDVFLCEARWRLCADDVQHLLGASANDQVRLLQRWRAERGWPRMLGCDLGNAVSPLDLDSVLSIEAFVGAIRTPRDLVLSELPASESGLGVEGPEGRFRSEISLLVRAEREALPSPCPQPVAEPVVHPPGSEWLSLRLDCGTAMVDEILGEVVEPVVRAARARFPLQWFFVRYADPRWHLRLRFHVEDREQRGWLRDQLEEAAGQLLRRELVTDVSQHTYVPETARYGGAIGMKLAERIFTASSDHALRVLPDLAGSEDRARWLAVLGGVHQIHALLLPELDERQPAMASLADGFAREHAADGALSRAIAARFRQDRSAVEAMLADPPEAILRFRAELTPPAEELRAASARGALTLPLPAIAESLVHMHANRMFVGHARAQEVVVYAYLAKAYRSARVRRQ